MASVFFWQNEQQAATFGLLMHKKHGEE